MLHTIVALNFEDMRKKGLEITAEFVQFVKFLYKVIFPGGFLRRQQDIICLAEDAQFEVQHIESLQPHYARTLDVWAANLAANRDVAIEMRSAEEFDRYMKYLTGCADYFRSGHIDICQFTCIPD